MECKYRKGVSRGKIGTNCFGVCFKQRKWMAMIMRKIVGKIKKLLDNNMCLAFMINAVFLLFAILFCDMKYEVSDDFIVDGVLSGAFGTGYNEYLLFSNILYGYVLKALYQITSIVSWYFVSHILICYLSLCAVTYIILDKNHRYVGITLSIVFISFFSDDLYILPQFTKTAAMAICAGGALFLFGMWNGGKKKKRWRSIICGACLALGGTLIRFGNIYIGLVYLLFMFIKYFWDARKEDKTIFKASVIFLACGILIGTSYFLRNIDTAIWNEDEDYSNYKVYNHMRASVTDVTDYGYESIAQQLGEIGNNETDYYMLESWNFLDQDYYTAEIVEQVSHIKKDYSNNVNHTIKSVYSQFIERGYQKYIVVMGIATLMLLMLFLQPKKFLWEVLELGVTAMMLMYFFYRGRVVYRVEYSIFVSMGISLVTFFQVKDVDVSVRKIMVYWSIVFCVCKIPLYIPDKSYETKTSEEYSQYISDVFFESWNFDIRKYRCNVNKRQPYGALTAYMEEDQEGYYLLDFSSTIQSIYYNYKPWLRLPGGYWNNYSYLGGVTSGYPDNELLWEKQGIDSANPYKSLVNDNVYVVDNNFYETKLDYLREHYYPNARRELVDVIDGYKIWKFYKE